MKSIGNVLFPLTSTGKLCLPDCFGFIMPTFTKVTEPIHFYAFYPKKIGRSAKQQPPILCVYPWNLNLTIFQSINIIIRVAVNAVDSNR